MLIIWEMVRPDAWEDHSSMKLFSFGKHVQVRMQGKKEEQLLSSWAVAFQLIAELFFPTVEAFYVIIFQLHKEEMCFSPFFPLAKISRCEEEGGEENPSPFSPENDGEEQKRGKRWLSTKRGSHFEEWKWENEREWKEEEEEKRGKCFKCQKRLLSSSEVVHDGNSSLQRGSSSCIHLSGVAIYEREYSGVSSLTNTVLCQKKQLLLAQKKFLRRKAKPFWQTHAEEEEKRFYQIHFGSNYFLQYLPGRVFLWRSVLKAFCGAIINISSLGRRSGGESSWGTPYGGHEFQEWPRFFAVEKGYFYTWENLFCIEKGPFPRQERNVSR